MRHRRITFTYELLDKNGQLKKQLRNVLSCNVRYASMARLKGSAVVTMRDDSSIDFINDMIRVKCTINGRQYSLGEYLISSSKRDIKGASVVRECQCFSKLKILDDDKVEDRYVVNAGVNILNEVKRLIGVGLHDIGYSPAVLQSPMEWDVGTPKLTIINDLLDVINYTGLRVGLNGKYIATPYVLPSEREVEHNLLADQDSIIFRDKSDELDLFDVPNVVVLRTNAAEVDPPLQATHENTNGASTTSIPSRGRRIVHFEEVNNVVDQSQLNALAKRRLYELSDVYNVLSMSTAIHPESFGYMPCVYVKTPDIDGKFIQTTCEIECKAGGRMTRTLRRAVRL